MIGPFCYRDIANDEEFIEHLKKRNKIYIFIVLCGIISFFCLLFAAHTLAEYTIGFFAGVDSGLIAGGVVLLFKNYRTLKNRQKIKEERIKISDERSRMISDHSSKAALIGILIEAYIICIVSILMNNDIYRICVLLITSFILIYAIAFRFYSKKY